MHPEVWQLLGFRSGVPDTFELELAFAALDKNRFERSELRAFISAVELFAASDLFRDFSR